MEPERGAVITIKLKPEQERIIQNVLSEFNRRGEPDRRVKDWLETADTDSLYVSALTLGEIRMGVELLPPRKRRT